MSVVILPPGVGASPSWSSAAHAVSTWRPRMPEGDADWYEFQEGACKWWCKLCGKYADGSHTTGQTHVKRAAIAREESALARSHAMSGQAAAAMSALPSTPPPPPPPPPQTSSPASSSLSTAVSSVGPAAPSSGGWTPPPLVSQPTVISPDGCARRAPPPPPSDPWLAQPEGNAQLARSSTLPGPYAGIGVAPTAPVGNLADRWMPPPPPPTPMNPHIGPLAAMHPHVGNPCMPEADRRAPLAPPPPMIPPPPTIPSDDSIHSIPPPSTTPPPALFTRAPAANVAAIVSANYGITSTAPAAQEASNSTGAFASSFAQSTWSQWRPPRPEGEEDWFEYRENECKWFCLLCESFADGNHTSGKRHSNRVAYRLEEMAAAMAQHVRQQSPPVQLSVGQGSHAEPLRTLPLSPQVSPTGANASKTSNPAPCNRECELPQRSNPEEEERNPWADMTSPKPPLAKAKPQSEPTARWWHKQDEDPIERSRVHAGLQRREQGCTLEIRTLTSLDTVPLGTDLDPLNGYRNLWAAEQIRDPTAQQMAKIDLGCRVLDGENIGYSFGADVCNQPGSYELEGVRRAVQHFRQQNLKVVLVSKRAETNQELFDADTSVVIAQNVDDVVVLKQAHERNCPIVSTANFEDWSQDPRLSPELRRWANEIKLLQIHFSWGAQGEFVGTYDLPPLVLRSACKEPITDEPRASGSQTAYPCGWCEKLATDGWWKKWWPRGARKYEWAWYCRSCHEYWR